jgi:predicted AlkP superfamily phosphohydrolase/phosphomutase
VPGLRAELESALYALRDPYSQAPVIARVHACEELFHGPCLERAPDLLLELALDAGYSYNLMPSTGAPNGSGPFRRLRAHEFLGRKGRSLPGSHRERGLYVACGPRVRALGEIDAAMADVSATLLARMDVQNPLDLDGAILHAALHTGAPPRAEDSALPVATVAAADPRLETGRVEERLRRLGYIE